MPMQLTDRIDCSRHCPAMLETELLQDQLADVLAASIEARQLLWNLGPRSRLGLEELLADLAQDCLRWTDQIARRLWDRGTAPSAACVRPLLRPDPSGGRRLDEQVAGVTAGHLAAKLAKRTGLRAEHAGMIDAGNRGLLRTIERELTLYAALASQLPRLVG